LTVKLRVTELAATELAVIEQVPVLTRVTRLLAALQTPVVVEVRVTGRPETSCAAIANGEIPKIWLGIASNVISGELETVHVPGLDALDPLIAPLFS